MAELNKFACELLRLISNELGDRKFEFISEAAESLAGKTIIVPIDEEAFADPESIAKAFIRGIPYEATRCYRLPATRAIEQCYTWHNPDNGVNIRVTRMWDVMKGKILTRVDGAFS